MKRFIFLLLLLSLVFTLSSCGQRRAVEPSFYYWKSTFQLSDGQLDTLRQLKVGRLYVKFFDVVWQGRAVPEAETRFVTRPPEDLDIVPTVFITNTTLVHLPQDEVDELAEKITSKVLRMAGNNLGRPVTEVQVDCDWNQTTREKFFQLVRGIRSRLGERNIKLSATIRLHQIKYKNQTGVPPADRGMLMAYNVETVQKRITQNSIFNSEIVKDYTANIDRYPLPLDVALPIFSWGVVFQGDRFIGLINNLGEEDVQDSRFFARRGRNSVQVLQDTSVRGIRLYHGDTVRLESANPRDVVSASKTLRRKLSFDGIHVALYHFDDLGVRRTGYAKIRSIFAAFTF